MNRTKAGWRLRDEVVVDLSHDYPEYREVKHFGTVAERRTTAAGRRYRVSGHPGRWFPAGQLTAAPRPPIV